MGGWLRLGMPSEGDSQGFFFFSFRGVSISLRGDGVYEDRRQVILMGHLTH